MNALHHVNAKITSKFGLTETFLLIDLQRCPQSNNSMTVCLTV